MTTSLLKRYTLRIPAVFAAIAATIIILMPFHAFLTVWASSLVGHYTALRLWKEVLLAALVLPAGYLLLKDNKLRKDFVSSKLNLLILGYSAVSLIWGFASLALDVVTPKALGYGLIVNLRFLVFFLIIWVAIRTAPKVFINWPKWLAYPLALVILVGLLQYFVLPYDFMRHFGYAEDTIRPYATINGDAEKLRVISTLRGPNNLGAYSLLSFCIFLALWLKQRKKWQVALDAGSVVILFLTLSRSAWIGAIVGLLVLGVYGVRSQRAKRIGLLTCITTLAALSIVAFAMRDNTTVQDLVLHTNDEVVTTETSTDGHIAAFRDGVMDIATHPLGSGVGTAGPASVYNQNKVEISESYFLQIGQEVGLLGLLLFIGINVLLARDLWLRRRDALALGLLAALFGLTIVNLLLHSWADDTLAYIFWGLAAVALASKPTKIIE